MLAWYLGAGYWGIYPGTVSIRLLIIIIIIAIIIICNGQSRISIVVLTGCCTKYSEFQFRPSRNVCFCRGWGPTKSQSYSVIGKKVTSTRYRHLVPRTRYLVPRRYSKLVSKFQVVHFRTSLTSPCPLLQLYLKQYRYRYGCTEVATIILSIIMATNNGLTTWYWNSFIIANL